MREGMYTINGRDLWTEFGVMIDRVSAAELLALPEPKARLTHDWEDEDGEEVLLTPTLTKARDVTLTCLIRAANGSEFWGKYYGLYDELTQGAVALHSRELNETYSLLLTGFGKPEKLTRIAGQRVAVKFTVTLRELQPKVLRAALVDDMGNAPVDDYNYYLSKKWT
jgi:hypothetical protein